MKKEIDKYQNHNTARMKELFTDSTNYDLLFLGSSRTHLTINPAMTDSVCGINSYNGGMEGTNLFEFNMILEAYLQNHPPPKWVVLTLDLHSLAANGSFYNYAQYFSYIQNNIIRQYLINAGYSMFRLKFFPFLEMTDYDDNTKGYFIKGIMNDSEIQAGDFQYKGYLSNTDVKITTVSIPAKPGIMVITDSGRKYLESIMHICKAYNIRLIFNYVPEYNHTITQHFTNSNEIFGFIDSTAKANNIHFIRGDSLDICNDPGLFANPGHLNREGAQQYSLILARDLKNILGDKKN